MATHSFSTNMQDYKDFENYFNSIINQNNNFENRIDQNKMSYLIKRYINSEVTQNTSLLLEAGTGTGKTFAYLVPLFQFCNKKSKKKENCKIIIATNTIGLQEQIYRKDIPFIRDNFPEVTTAKIKGRNNYICFKKLFENTQQSLFEEETEKGFYQEILNWIYEGGSGDIEDMPVQIEDPQILAGICGDYACLGRGCNFYTECILEKKKREIQDADIIITNHSLVLADFLEKEVLPKYSILVLDEAHNFYNNAVKAATRTISLERIIYLERKFEGKYCGPHFKAVRKKVKTEKTIKELYGQITSLIGLYPESRIREPKNQDIAESIIGNLSFIEEAAKEASSRASHNIIKHEIENFIDEVARLKRDIKIFSDFPQNHVFWQKNGEIKFCPVDAEFLKDFWHGKKSILVSATLSVANSFNIIKEKLHIPEKSYCYRFASPFNYKKNALLYVPQDSIKPNQEKYIEHLAGEITKLVKLIQNRIFVLFTSYETMHKTHQYLQEKGELSQFTIVIQNGKKSKNKILEEFRSLPNSILFGVSSFWEGVDEDINGVIITKLPFEVPVEPFQEARYELLTSRGKNPFWHEALPDCALRLKQGTGRLIRNRDKKGIIAVLDPRIREKWGRIIIKTLPEMRMTSNWSEVVGFLGNAGRR